MEKRRVVISGMGVISSIGIGKEVFWENLLQGVSGISEIDSLDTSQLTCHKGGEIKSLHIPEYITEEQVADMGKASKYGVIASNIAIKDSGIDLKEIDSERIGISIGTTYGEAQVLQDIHNELYAESQNLDLGKLSMQLPYNQINANIAKSLGIKGDSVMIPNACAAGNFAIGYAFDLISNNKIDYMLCGGVDVFSRMGIMGFNRLLAVAPEKVQPFDKNRSGMMVGEGAGIVMLEYLDSALERGAHIYAEVLGYGVSNDAYHMVTPHPKGKGVLIAMNCALEQAGISREDVDFVSLHGTGTKANDKAEFNIMEQMFGDRDKSVLVNSIKSMLGHTMGAASALEAIVCALIIENDKIPPTINYETPDPDCNFDCVPNVYRDHTVNVALNNSYAFGGNNTCLVLKKYVA